VFFRNLKTTLLVTLEVVLEHIKLYKMRAKGSFTALIAFFFFAVSAAICIVFLILLYCDGYRVGKPVLMSETGQIGDFIGGVVGTIISAAALFFLYLTFREQRNTSLQQHIESCFFEMLRIHLETVNSMKYNATRLLIDKGSLYIAPQEYTGRAIFDLMYLQLITCRNELRHLLCKHSRLYTAEYEKTIMNNKVIKERGIDIYELGYVDIAYCVVFYGVNSEGLMILKNLLYRRYKKNLVDTILKYISLKPASNKNLYKRWEYISGRSRRKQILDLVEDIYEWRQKKIIRGYQPRFPDYSVGYNNDYVKYYGGFQYLLSHYYRHLFYVVKYVNEQKFLSYNEKYQYVKNLRTMLSNSEQVLLFFNSLSSIGRQWELEALGNVDLKGYEKKDFELITKYNLIKNIPNEMLYGVNYKQYYPSVNYEFDEILHKKNYH